MLTIIISKNAHKTLELLDVNWFAYFVRFLL